MDADPSQVEGKRGATDPFEWSSTLSAPFPPLDRVPLRFPAPIRSVWRGGSFFLCTFRPSFRPLPMSSPFHPARTIRSSQRTISLSIQARARLWSRIRPTLMSILTITMHVQTRRSRGMVLVRGFQDLSKRSWKVHARANGTEGSWQGRTGEAELGYLAPEVRWRQHVRTSREEEVEEFLHEPPQGQYLPVIEDEEEQVPERTSSAVHEAVRVVQSAPKATRRRRKGGALRKFTTKTGLALGAVMCAVAWRTAVVNGGVEHNVSLAITEAVDKLNDLRILGHMKVEEAPEWDLVSVGKTPWGTIQELRTDAAQSFLDMQAAARREGIHLVPISGFRSIKDQEGVFFDIKGERRQTASERALVSAPPGYSEHHTGYALDIGTKPFAGLTEDFEYTAAFAWLKDNAMRWHFELSFPRDNPDGIMYEPWHWRWVGNIHALETFAAKRS